MNQAVGMESPDGGLTFHNGQGIRYTPAVCQRCLRGHGMTQPVSRPGNPHDNAVAESFFGTLKHELVNGRRCGTGRRRARTHSSTSSSTTTRGGCTPSWDTDPPQSSSARVREDA